MDNLINLNLGFRLSTLSLYTPMKSKISRELFYSIDIYLYTLRVILSLSQAKVISEVSDISDLHSFIDSR